MGRWVLWDGDAWEDYCEWQKDKATLKRINALIKDARRDPFDGIGKPAPLNEASTVRRVPKCHCCFHADGTFFIFRLIIRA